MTGGHRSNAVNTPASTFIRIIGLQFGIMTTEFYPMLLLKA